MDTSQSTPNLSPDNFTTPSPLNPRQRRVAYISSPSLTAVSSQLPSNIGRSRQVHNLVRALGLLYAEDDEQDDQDEPAGKEAGEPSRATVLPPLKATRKDLGRFHDLDYVDTLLSPKTVLSPTNSPTSSVSSSSDSSSDGDDDVCNRPLKRFKPNLTLAARKVASLQKYGLLDDSPPFPSLAAYVLALAGGASAAAKAIIHSEEGYDVSTLWDGGRHHGKRSEASGFCFINDAVLVILSLLQQRIVEGEQGGRRRKPRVMYLDFDVHHGDGVALAFLADALPPPNVLTLSIHHHAVGFFPSSALSSLTSVDTPSPHTLSLPLQVGTSAASLRRVWIGAVEKIKDSFNPDFVVVCCGVDGMAGDGKGVWNLGAGEEEEGGLGWCVRRIVEWEKKTVLLGGGGYNHPNAARAFATFTSIALGRPPLDPTTPIPEEGISDEDWESYGPSFEMGVPVGNMRDHNTDAYLDKVCRTFEGLARRVRAG